jgi:translation initiation factor 2B subunit (eIF-2B alpha/beta/delta family)
MVETNVDRDEWVKKTGFQGSVSQEKSAYRSAKIKSVLRNFYSKSKVLTKPVNKSIQSRLKSIKPSTTLSASSPAMKAKMQALRNRKTTIRKQFNAPTTYTPQQYPNTFLQRLQQRKNLYAMEEAARQKKIMPAGYARMVNDAHDAERAQKRAFAAQANITKAHEMMDKRSMNFLQTEGTILTTSNMFSSSNPNKMDIMRTGRPTLLSPSEDNILRAKHKLTFGKV